MTVIGYAAARPSDAMGGRRLTPGQAVDALEEAIEIIRQIWAAGRPGGVHVRGTYYQVNGAKRGPAPAHDMAIWVGALKPKMLRLVGRAAHGWLPSLSYLPGGRRDLAEMNKYIDEAALSAGRAPSAVRRLLDPSGRSALAGHGLRPQHWAEQLAGITLEDGTSGSSPRWKVPGSTSSGSVSSRRRRLDTGSYPRATPSASQFAPQP